MKRLIYLFTLSLAAACLPAGRDINPNIVPGSGLYMPEGGAYCDLSNGKGVNFEWGPAMAEDNGFVSYEVLFDRVGGDFSQPVSRVPGQVNGSRSYVSISAKNLSKIARKAGIGIYSEGELVWTVRASKGVGGVVYSEKRKLKVRTINSMDPLPVSVSFSGAAMEGPMEMVASPGIDKSGALEGGFELFARINAGAAFQIKDERNRYYILNADGTMTSSAAAVDTRLTGGNDIRWLQLDFDGMAWSAKTVKKIEYYAAAWTGTMQTDRRELSYQGLGVWKLADYPNTISDNEAGDSRHRFDMTLSDDSVVYLGTEASLPGSYTDEYLRVNLYTSQTMKDRDWGVMWNYLPADFGRPLDVILHLNADNPLHSWWHEYHFK